MPSREKMTPEVRQQILAIYEETCSVRMTGRRVNVHENSVRLVLKATKGLCADCTAPIQLGRPRCASCTTKRTAWSAKRRKERRRQGVCQVCDERIQPPSIQFCDTHRLNHARVSRNHVIKRDERLREAAIPEQQQREKHLRHSYGQAGVDAWRRDNGSCSLCAASYTTQRIHVHHINGDDTHHVVENLVCLCSHCHRLIHGLLRVQDPAQLTRWFNSHYPQAPLSRFLLSSRPRAIKKDSGANQTAFALTFCKIAQP